MPIKLNPPEGGSPPRDEERIDFQFQTFGELKRAFGEKRAAALLKAKQRKDAAGSDVALTAADIDVALRFLRGEKTGAQSSKALKAFKAYFSSSDQRRKACEMYLIKLLPHE